MPPPAGAFASAPASTSAWEESERAWTLLLRVTSSPAAQPSTVSYQHWNAGTACLRHAEADEGTSHDSLVQRCPVRDDRSLGAPPTVEAARGDVGMCPVGDERRCERVRRA